MDMWNRIPRRRIGHGLTDPSHDLAAPRALGRVMLPGEQIEIITRLHPIALLPEASWPLAGVALATWITWLGAYWLAAIAWMVALWLLLRFGWQWLEWRFDRIVVSTQRVWRISGLLHRQVPMLPLSKVSDLTYEQTLLGQICRYGMMIFESAGQVQGKGIEIVNFVPHPDAFYVKVCQLALPKPETQDDD